MFRLANILEHPWAFEKINAIGRQCDKPSLLSDIKEACSNERAFFVVDGSTFFVIKPLFDEENSLLVWAAYSKKIDACKRYRNYLEGMARAVNSRRLIFYTKRHGFDRLAPHLGYRQLDDDDGYKVWEKRL